jgi:cyclopropane-fatty-acyl-phospholipid synthase
LLDGLDTSRSRRVLLSGWEQFAEPVDRIISLEAIEAFPPDRYEPFFKTCSSILPGDGRMVLQAILGHPLKKWPELGIPVTMTDLRFMRFIAKEIFPGGSVPGEEQIVTLATEAGFTVEDKQLLDEHYVRTLDLWSTALEAHHDEAVAATSEEVYERYMKYLTGCSDFFKRRISELGQFTLVKG